MIFASNNKGKLREIKKIFDEYEIKSLREAGVDVDVVEDQDSFYGNALKKAKEIYELTKEAVVADDSGLCITELDGWPGVFTHRFMGEDTSDDIRNDAIIEKTNACLSRKATVVCNLVYFDGTDIIVGEGVLNGVITTERRGENGFGFDDIFELENGKTLAELSADEKNEVSARAMAALDLKKKLVKKL